MPDPIPVGGDAEKVEGLAKRFNIPRWTTDLDKAPADKNDTVFFLSSGGAFAPTRWLAMTVSVQPHFPI